MQNQLPTHVSTTVQAVVIRAEADPERPILFIASPRYPKNIHVTLALIEACQQKVATTYDEARKDIIVRDTAGNFIGSYHPQSVTDSDAAPLKALIANAIKQSRLLNAHLPALPDTVKPACIVSDVITSGVENEKAERRKRWESLDPKLREFLTSFCL